MKIINRNDATHTGHTRDAALRRLRQANRWLIAGSAILTGLLTEAAASAFPGHTIHKGATSARRHASKHKALQPPAQAPKVSTTTTTTPSETATSTETQAPSESSAPAQTPAESNPTTESAPEQSAPVEEAQSSAPVQETHEAAPPVEEEHSEPVVSGGS